MIDGKTARQRKTKVAAFCMLLVVPLSSCSKRLGAFDTAETTGRLLSFYSDITEGSLSIVSRLDRQKAEQDALVLAERLEAQNGGVLVSDRIFAIEPYALADAENQSVEKIMDGHISIGSAGTHYIATLEVGEACAFSADFDGNPERPAFTESVSVRGVPDCYLKWWLVPDSGFSVFEYEATDIGNHSVKIKLLNTAQEN